MPMRSWPLTEYSSEDSVLMRISRKDGLAVMADKFIFIVLSKSITTKIRGCFSLNAAVGTLRTLRTSTAHLGLAF